MGQEKTLGLQGSQGQQALTCEQDPKHQGDTQDRKDRPPALGGRQIRDGPGGYQVEHQEAGRETDQESGHLGKTPAMVRGRCLEGSQGGRTVEGSVEGAQGRGAILLLAHVSIRMATNVTSSWGGSPSR